jgi:hypothetical protein
MGKLRAISLVIHSGAAWMTAPVAGLSKRHVNPVMALVPEPSPYDFWAAPELFRSRGTTRYDDYALR